MSDRLVRLLDESWASLRSELNDLRLEVRRSALAARAEVAASVPTFDTLSSFPTGGAGMLGLALDTGKLYYHNGTTWVEMGVA